MKDSKMSNLKRIEIMNRASFLRCDAKMILKLDFSDLDEIEDVNRVSKFFCSMVQKMPKKLIVGLVCFNDLKIADEVVQEMISLTKPCNPYFRATAVIATDNATIELAEAVKTHFGKINMPIYQKEEPAKEWLFSQ